MSGKLVVRRDDGSVETVAVTGAIRIGSAPQSDVRIDGEGVLPLHANAGVDGGEYWIRDAGNAGLAINGQRVAEKRTLRHLDVITVGAGVNVIFSTTVAALPGLSRSRRPLPPPAAAAAPAAAATAPPQMTVAFQRAEVAAPSFKPADADEGAGPNTMVGSAPGAMPAFEAADAEADNTMLGPATPRVAPKFQPLPDEEGPNTVAAAPGIIPKFRADPEPGPSPNTLVEPASRGAAPKFEAPPSLGETVTQPGASAPPPTVRAKPPARDQPITGVTFRGIGSVLNAPLGRSVIGRGATATIRIDSAELSKVHAFLDVTSTEVTVTDQKSVNGTAVNGARTSGPRRLIEGDRVSFATFEFRVEFVRQDGSE